MFLKIVDVELRAAHRRGLGGTERFPHSKLVYFIISTDEVTRDYAYGETDPLMRRCCLLPWIPADLEEVSGVTTEPPDSYYEVRTINIATQISSPVQLSFAGFAGKERRNLMRIYFFFFGRHKSASERSSLSLGNVQRNNWKF